MSTQVGSCATEGPIRVGHQPTRYHLVEPETAELVPGEFRGRLLSLSEFQDVVHADTAVRSCRRARQESTRAEVDNVLARRAQYGCGLARGDELRVLEISLLSPPGHWVLSLDVVVAAGSRPRTGPTHDCVYWVWR